MKKLITLIAVLASLTTAAQIKVSQLPTAGDLTGAELVNLVQSGVSKKTTAQDIANLANLDTAGKGLASRYWTQLRLDSANAALAYGQRQRDTLFNAQTAFIEKIYTLDSVELPLKVDSVYYTDSLHVRVANRNHSYFIGGGGEVTQVALDDTAASIRGSIGVGGMRGSALYYGSPTPPLFFGQTDGDFYLRTSNYFLYRLNAGTWTNEAFMIPKTGSNLTYNGVNQFTSTARWDISSGASGLLIAPVSGMSRLGDTKLAGNGTIVQADDANSAVTLTAATSISLGAPAVYASSLTGATTQMVTADASGKLGVQAIPSVTEIIVACSDEATAITTGTAKVTFRMPCAMTVTGVRASLTTASSSGTPTIDINEGGTTILSTKLTVDASEKTSTTAAIPAVISDTALADDAEITIDVDTAGTGAAGLKVTLTGTR